MSTNMFSAIASIAMNILFGPRELTFEKVVDKELADIKKRRQAAGIDGDGLPDLESFLQIKNQSQRTDEINRLLNEVAEGNEAWQEAVTREAPVKDGSGATLRCVRHDGLVGLAFSGGGIRSSTFNLGILQGLYRVGLFPAIDYLSTVSGGGYIGSCLSSCMNGAGAGDASQKGPNTDFPFEHRQGRQEPAPFRHLRNNARYLAPRGVVDLVRIPAILLRGITVNFLIILPYLLMAAIVTVCLYPTVEHLEVLRKAPVFGLGEGASMRGTSIALAVMFGVFFFYPLAWRVMRLFKLTFNWPAREMVGRVLGALILAVTIVAFVEVQPLAIHFFGKTLIEIKTWVFSGGLDPDWVSAATAVVGTVIAFFSSRLAKKDTGWKGQFVLYVIGFLGFFVFWLVYLNLCRWAIIDKPPAPGWVHWMVGFDAYLPRQLDSVWRFFVGADSPATFAYSYLNVYAALTVILLAYGLYCVDINASSLHGFYRDKLSKAFLFRWIDDTTQPNDSIRLSQLTGNQGPFHLINAAVSVSGLASGGEDDFRRGRRADFFCFSKYHVGGPGTGYCRTEDMEREVPHLNLGTAMAISGAAAAANMGRATVRVLTFILAMLNIRLNYWLPHPRVIVSPLRKSLLMLVGGTSRAGPWNLLLEMLGWDRMPFFKNASRINVSDGGHIENLGVYELLRRQCRLIIVGDGECDDGLTFDGLANLILLAQVDLSIRIDMEGLDAIRAGDTCHAIGKIKYGGGREGRLLYLKSCRWERKGSGGKSLLGPFDFSPYIARYAAEHPKFPHEPTSDQFFDEAQFECYRALGYAVAMSTFEKNWPV